MDSGFLQTGTSSLPPKSMLAFQTRYCAPINLYANHSAMFQLIISGDIETNPGPVNCDSCQKTVRSHRKQLVCENCFSKSHMKCSVKIILNGPKIQTWTCHVCTNRLLPFHNVSIDETIEERSHDQADESIQVPHQNNTITRALHT